MIEGPESGIPYANYQPPDWYTTFRDAALLGVRPWELEGLEHTRTCWCWRFWANAVHKVESEAREELRKRANQNPSSAGIGNG